MRKDIKIRDNFTDVNIDQVSHISYTPYLEVPKCTDYIEGEKREIVLRNSSSGELELIRYQLVGAIPFSRRPGHYWYWGKIEAKDYNCYLLFFFNGDGSLRSISATFCGEGLTVEEFTSANKRIKYAAQITACGVF